MRAPDAVTLSDGRLLAVWQHEDDTGIALRYRSLALASRSGGGSGTGLLWLALAAGLVASRRRHAQRRWSRRYRSGETPNQRLKARRKLALS